MREIDEVLKEIEILFREELEDNSISLNLNSSADDIEQWNSVNNLMLISAIEEKFKVSFPIEVIFEARNIGDLCKYIIENDNSEG